NAVTAPEIFRGVEIMHRTALAFRAAGRLAVELGHERFRVHADGDRVAVIAVSSDHVIVLAHQRTATDRDGLLANVEMKKAADFFSLIGAKRTLLEPPDAHHFPEQLDLRVGGEG